MIKKEILVCIIATGICIAGIMTMSYLSHIKKESDCVMLEKPPADIAFYFPDSYIEMNNHYYDFVYYDNGSIAGIILNDCYIAHYHFNNESKNLIENKSFLFWDEVNEIYKEWNDK